MAFSCGDGYAHRWACHLMMMMMILVKVNLKVKLMDMKMPKLFFWL